MCVKLVRILFGLAFVGAFGLAAQAQTDPLTHWDNPNSPSCLPNAEACVALTFTGNTDEYSVTLKVANPGNYPDPFGLLYFCSSDIFAISVPILGPPNQGSLAPQFLGCSFSVGDAPIFPGGTYDISLVGDGIAYNIPNQFGDCKALEGASCGNGVMYLATPEPNEAVLLIIGLLLLPLAAFARRRIAT